MLMESSAKTMPIALDGVEPLISPEDAARILGLTDWTVRRYIREGKLTGLMVGRRYMLRPEEVRGFIKRCVVGSAKA